MADQRDFIYQIQRHSIRHFGNWRHPSTTDPVALCALREAAEPFRLVVASGQSSSWPRAAWHGIRALLSVPRCTNSVCLYLFFAADALLFVLCIKIGRLLVRRFLDPDRLPEALRPHIDKMPRIFAFPTTIVTVWVLFRLLHYRWDWIEEPHTLLTLALTMYLFAYTYLDTLIPDFN